MIKICEWQFRMEGRCLSFVRVRRRQLLNSDFGIGGVQIYAVLWIGSVNVGVRGFGESCTFAVLPQHL